jgi:2,5-dihydroxypyridine 5,6-dioxygenase
MTPARPGRDTRAAAVGAPASSESVAGLVGLFGQELALCKLMPDETVAILTEGRARQRYADAFALAAQAAGARVFSLDLPSGSSLGDGELGVKSGATGLAELRTTALEALKSCDLLIDLAFMLWSHEQHEIRAAGTRILSCIEPVPVLERLFPSEERRRRVLEARDLIASGSRIRVTSAAGTDVEYVYGEYKVHHQYGFTDEPGRWDHFASAMVNTVANDGAVDGVVVLAPGDLVFPYCRYVEQPVSLTIRDGYVTDVAGGTDALLITDYLELFDDPRGYQVSHIGWGMDERARWDALAAGAGGIGMDARCYHGSVMFSTGPNIEFGGDNDTACHIDIPMRGCSLWIDEQLIIDNGRMAVAALAGDVLRGGHG